jgi:hypothetical protein
MIHPLTPPEVTPQVIAVKVPLGSKIDVVVDDILHVIFEDKTNHSIALPRGKWEPLGLASSATEETAKRIVEDCPHFAKCWKNYTPSIDPKNWMSSIFTPKLSCWTALESLTTLMNFKKLFLVNPYGDRPERMAGGQDGDSMNAYQAEIKQWQEAEKNKSDFVFLINPTPAINI